MIYKNNKTNYYKLFKVILYITFILFMLILLIPSKAFGSLYNTTNLSNANNPLEQARALNNIVDNFIGYGLILISFVIPFVILNANTGDATAALGGASFFAGLSASMLLPLRLISLEIYQMIIIMVAVSILVSLWAGSKR